MSCNYCWNQPKKYERYDLYLDGKIKANDFVYRTKDAENGEISTTTLSEKIDEIESRLQTHFTFEHVAKLPTEGKETVIYLVGNADTSDDPDANDKYDEYMWDKEHQKFELIGSGSYAKQQADLDKESARAIGEENRIEEKLDQEIAARIKDVDDEEERAKNAERDLLNKFADYTTTAVLEESYVTITSLQEQIKVLNETIAALEERIAALEPTPEPEEPENGDVTESTDPETPTE